MRPSVVKALIRSTVPWAAAWYIRAGSIVRSSRSPSP